MLIEHSKESWRNFTNIEVGQVFLYKDKPAMKVRNTTDNATGVVYLETGKTLWGASVPHGNEKFRLDTGAFITLTI